eukprot:TRINITY_DN92913_c0_g1_i1.p1 TRINITY_DN92913_c0_g1~~TRINITY_DN92913_c0_g1_i1.p1  ORF type:complete len:277 (+),score=90.39 TRINITY_DN92913_c0_g1_i1:102-932(+)
MSFVGPAPTKKAKIDAPKPKLGDLPLARLKSIARMKCISLAGCFEKSDIISALKKGGIDDSAAAADWDRQKEQAQAAAKAKAAEPKAKAPFPPHPPGTNAGTTKGVQAKAKGQPAAFFTPKYSEAGRLKAEIQILKKENGRLEAENQAMKWRLGMAALKLVPEDEQEDDDMFPPPPKADGSRAEMLKRLNEDPNASPADSPQPQEWSAPDEEAMSTALDFGNLPTPKAMAAEEVRKKLGLSKGAYVIPKPSVDPICWEFKHGYCKNGVNCPWQHVM